MPTMRDSNIELLRILCIFLIIVLHAIGFNNCCEGITGAFLKAIGNCGVTTFVLISGYYGISFNPKKIFHLRNIASFYLLFALLFELYTHRPVSGSNIFSVFFPIISGKYWFLTCYSLLIILSPYINHLLDSLSHNKFRILVFLLVFVFYFIPTFFKYHILGDDGKNIICMTSAYIFGRYIAIVKLTDKYRTTSLLITFIISISSIVLLDHLQQCLGITNYLAANHLVYKLDGDNSLFILIASTCMFLWFPRAIFHSRIINQIARSVFAVYILEWFVRPYLLQYIDIPSLSPLIQPLATIGIAIFIFFLCTAIDQFRMLTTSNIEKKVESFECALFERAKNKTKIILQRCP